MCCSLPRLRAVGLDQQLQPARGQPSPALPTPAPRSCCLAAQVNIPCYQDSSPVKDYLGGNQAYMMMAWSNANNDNGAPRCAWAVHGLTTSHSNLY